MNFRCFFCGWLMMIWFCSCNAPHEISTLGNEKGKLFTVIVCVRNSGAFFASGSSFCHIGQPYYVIDVLDWHNKPITEVVYKNMSQGEFEELYRQLKYRPEVLTVQKIY